jgi:CheY-like chemotaxis protein
MNGATIMVVDDEPIVRRVMSRVLSQLGCEVVVAESGQDAVEVLAGLRAQPHALLLDITMPGWEGPETFVALREHGYQGPIFFMSGYAADDIAKRLAHLEVAGFLQKPIATKELIEKVGALLPPGISLDRRGRSQRS